MRRLLPWIVTAALLVIVVVAVAELVGRQDEEQAASPLPTLAPTLQPTAAPTAGPVSPRVATPTPRATSLTTPAPTVNPAPTPTGRTLASGPDGTHPGTGGGAATVGLSLLVLAGTGRALAHGRRRSW